MTRPLEDWADLKYLAGTYESHIVPFGTERAECEAQVPPSDAHGTGSFEELERAKGLPVCEGCASGAGIPLSVIGTPFLDERDPAVVEWSKALGVES